MSEFVGTLLTERTTDRGSERVNCGSRPSSSSVRTKLRQLAVSIVGEPNRSFVRSFVRLFGQTPPWHCRVGEKTRRKSSLPQLLVGCGSVIRCHNTLCVNGREQTNQQTSVTMSPRSHTAACMCEGKNR